MRKGRCNRCQKAAWVNRCTRDGKPLGEFCGDCFEVVQHDEPDRPEPTAGHSGNYHNDPGFDNVVRAAEEDR